MSCNRNSLLVSGFSPSFNPYKVKHNKPQRFIFRNGIRMEEDSDAKAPKLARVHEIVGRHAFKDCTAPVLTFDAYYLEKLGEGNKGTTQFRKCKIIYFLDDDEIKVYEQPQRNSGQPQGCIVGKGRFYKPDKGYYTLDDLNIGETLVLFGREYRLINCDEFTRKFLTEMGFRVRSPEPDVFDPITEDRNEMNILRSLKKPHKKEYKLASFYKNHPKRLRFYGVYGEGKGLFDEKREITLYYDLSNGTMKVVEERCINKWLDGRRDTRVLLRPTRVPKTFEPSLPPGEMGDPTLLNMAHDVQNVLIGGKYYKIQNPCSVVVDPNPVGGRKRDVEYYTEKDLDLGVDLNFFGTRIFLYDCDEFTKNYYSATYGKDLVTVSRPDITEFKTHKLVYKHEEFGEPEQTIRTNDPFTPIRHDADLRKFFKNDKFAYNVRELKFLARMITQDPVDKLRGFMVRWFMEDDTMDIRALDLDFENTSIMEHKHLSRMKVTKPRSSVGNFERCYYQPWDMYVGNIIYVRGKAYLLIDADEYTYDYMERNCNLFPHSNIKVIMTTFKEWVPDKCGPLTSRFEERDNKNCGHISYEDFKDALCEEIPEDIRAIYPEHVIKTIARYYADKEYIGLQLDDLIAKVKTELYRKKFYDFDDLKLSCEIQDEVGEGYLDPDRVYYALRSTSLPLNRDLLKSLIYKFPTKDGKTNYKELVEVFDWISNPVEYEKPDSYTIQINWERIENVKDMQKIKYRCFLTDMIA